MKLLQNKYLLYGLIILLTFLYVKSCSDKVADKNRHQDNLKVLHQEIKVGKTKLGQVTASKDVLEVTHEELKKQLWVKDDSLQDLLKDFRKVKAAFVINTTVNLEPFTIPLSPADELGVRPFRKANQHYTFSGAVLPNSVRLDTLQLFNTQRLVLGTHKGFFNRTTTATITNSNPYIQTTDLSTQVVTERVKRFGIGVYAGYGLGTNFTLAPQVGIGVSWDLLRF